MRYADSNVIRTGEMDIPCPCCGTSRASDESARGDMMSPPVFTRPEPQFMRWSWQITCQMRGCLCGCHGMVAGLMKGHTQEARDAEKAEAVGMLCKEGWRICNVSDQDAVQLCPNCLKVWEDMYGVRP